MKKSVIKLTVFLMLSAVGLCSYGQNLKPKRCANGKWGFWDKKIGMMVTPCKYDEAWIFRNGFAAVKLDGKWGCIDRNSREVIPCKYDRITDIYYNNNNEIAIVKLNGKWGYGDCFGNFYEGVTLKQACEKADREVHERAREKREKAEIEAREKAEKEATEASFSYFAKNYMVWEMNSWLQKGEFEKTDDWQRRISDNNRKAKETELLRNAEQAFIAERRKNIPAGDIALGAYDADEEVFLITNSVHGNWFVSVPVNEAPDFKNNWHKLEKIPQYVIINERIVFAGYKFEPVKAAAPGNNAAVQSNASPVKSDVAANIPSAVILYEKEESNPYKFRLYAGSGRGVSYAGFYGVSLETRFDGFALSAGVGTFINNVGWAVGAKWYFWKNLYWNSVIGAIGEINEFGSYNGYADNYTSVIGLSELFGIQWSWGSSVRFGVNAGLGLSYGFNYFKEIRTVYDVGISVSFGTK